MSVFVDDQPKTLSKFRSSLLSLPDFQSFAETCSY